MSIQGKITKIISDHQTYTKFSYRRTRSNIRPKDSEILEILHYGLTLHHVLVKIIPKIIEVREVKDSAEQIVLVQATLRLIDVVTGEIHETTGFGSSQSIVGKAIVKAMLDATQYAWLSCIQQARR